MIKVPSDIASRFNTSLADKAIPKNLHFHYRKWLRYYLDFCKKYGHGHLSKKSVSSFIKKLRDKKQSTQQQKQATHAVSIFFETERAESTQTKPTRKGTVPTSNKKPIQKTTGADWNSSYNALEAEIKLRHYSPKTLKAYRGTHLAMVFPCQNAYFGT